MKNEITLPTVFGTITLVRHSGAVVELARGFTRDDPSTGHILDAVEAVVLGHFAAGVDVTTVGYLEGLNSGLEAVDNNL
jgi:hypothetical protein